MKIEKGTKRTFFDFIIFKNHHYCAILMQIRNEDIKQGDKFPGNICQLLYKRILNFSFEAKMAEAAIIRHGISHAPKPFKLDCLH